MKRYSFWVLLLVIFMLSVSGRAFADSASTHIFLDGNELTISKDAQVQIVNGSVMVPLRLVTEQLGYAVKWDNLTKTATIAQAGKSLKLMVNNSTAESSGRPIQLDNPPLLSGSITLVPLRFVSEETGTAVGWDNITKTVYLTSPATVTEINKNIPPTSINLAPPAKPETTTETSNQGAVTGLSFSDNRLSISYSGNVTATTFSMTAKDRIVIDLPNTRFSESFIQSMALANKQNGIMEVMGHPDVSAIRYSVFSNKPSAIRIVMDLNSTKAYKMSNEVNGVVVVDLNEIASESQPEVTSQIPANMIPADTIPVVVRPNKKLIVLDAGHGGKDPGAVSPNKQKEKDFALSTALKIAELLKNDPNIDLVLTRSDDTYPTLQGRVKMANDLKADLFISIHANSIPTTSKSNPSGVETYYTRNDSLQFAKTVHKYLVPASGLADRGVRQNSLHVTRETTMPAILLECGYLSNAKDEALLFDNNFQQRIAEATVAGIKEYLGL